MNKPKIRNPILPGFYPDPSICRVGEDFYMVCSSFELYPGIPVFHSKDLANWEQLGYAMHQENGFHVEANIYAGGVMAPMIRYHKGTFYIINANFCDQGNFIVTATDPAGPWSKPFWLTDVPGIDASLFFDEDGKAYVIGTGDGRYLALKAGKLTGNIRLPGSLPGRNMNRSQNGMDLIQKGLRFTGASGVSLMRIFIVSRTAA